MKVGDSACGRRGVPSWSRTNGLRIRNPALYPAELWGRAQARIALLSLVVLLGGGGVAADECPPTGGIEGATATVGSGIAELRLEDGRIVRLPGLDVPAAAVPDLRRALGEILNGARLRLVPLREAPDRYGRLVARVVADGVWVEAALVGAGLARANLFPGEGGCLAALLAHENRGREARRGMWAGEGGLIAATDVSALGRHLGQFVVVEGRVTAVGVRDYATFLDFGSRWTESFAAVIRRADRARVEAVLGPARVLVQRRVRLRGVLDATAPPRLRVERAEAIEVLD